MPELAGPSLSRDPQEQSPAPAAGAEAELERLRAELDELRESERMYRASAEISRRLVWSADANGRVLSISRVFKSLTGIGAAEALKQGWLESVHPDDRSAVLDRWAHSLRTGDPFEVEFRAVLADGSSRTALSRAIAARDEEGRVYRWYGSTEDVHDERVAEEARREAEARLRDSEELHRLTLELSQQIVWSVEPDGTGLTLSGRYHDMTGMAPDEDAALSIHPDDREHVLGNWGKALAAGTPYADECRLRTTSGAYRFFRVRAAPLRGHDGKILRWYGLSEDIHEERLSELARRDVEQRYRLAVQATNDAVWDYDIVNGTIDWSDNSADMFGSPGEPLGRTSIGWWEERLHPDDRRRVERTLRAAIRSKQARWSETYRFRRDDGSYADILDRGFIIHGADDKAVRAIGAMADLTERHRAEAEIGRIQAELVHVSRLSAMGTMASTLAHELNQPLAAVSNFLSGARRIAAADPRSDPELLTAIEFAAAGAQRAGEIVRRLRELVSRRAVSVDIEHLPKLIEEASVLGFVDERLLGIVHQTQIEDGAEWVRADRIQIQQVVINLIRNAVDAMEGSETREIHITGRAAAGDMVEISVADTGSGIAPEHMDTLFSQFMTTKSGGMGIGLPICRTIVEAHGGKIWAENRTEGGAVFRFTLPAGREPKSTVN